MVARGTTRQINSRRLRLARALAAASRVDVVTDVEIDPTRYAKLENGTAHPTEIEVRRLAARLGVAPEFFAREISRELDDEVTHFRCKQSARQVARRRALAHATLLDELLCLLDRKVMLPRLRLPRCTGASPEDAATACRDSWGLSQKGALADVQREAELSGVFVVNGPAALMNDVDAFSTRVSTDAAVVVLKPTDPPSRSAFNVAHELGHLILHDGLETGDRDTEIEADRFASALLMPREGFSESWRRGPGSPDLAWLVQMKAWWRVSMQAMVHRAHALRLVSHATYQQFWKAIKWWGWEAREPGEFDWPRPRLLADCIESARSNFGLGPDQLANELGVRLPLLEELCGLDFQPRQTPADVGVQSITAHPRWSTTSAGAAVQLEIKASSHSSVFLGGGEFEALELGDREPIQVGE